MNVLGKADTEFKIFLECQKMERCVSVVMTVRNVENSIYDCMRSILDQTFDDFEIVIIDDLSTDRTRMIIEKFQDKRIRYYCNTQWLGLSKSRNKGVQQASGEYLFFTDGDCIASRNWIEQGLKYLKNPGYLGVEGRIFYVSKDYEPVFSDNVVETEHSGTFATANIAYKKSIIKMLQGFDERLTWFEDRDLALRVLKYGKIGFNSDMVVYHQRTIVTPEKLIKSAPFAKNRIFLFKKFAEKKFMFGRVLFPFNLAKIFFPPLILSSLFFKKFRTSDDYRLLPFMYIFVIYERLQLWKECAKERVFFI